MLTLQLVQGSEGSARNDKNSMCDRPIVSSPFRPTNPRHNMSMI